MIKTIWKRKVPVEMQAHDECSSGHRVPVKLTRKMSFSIYGCGKASPGAAHAARFLYLHSLTVFPAAQHWENMSMDLIGIQFWLLSRADKAMHTLVLRPSRQLLQRQMHSPASPPSALRTALLQIFPLRE